MRSLVVLCLVARAAAADPKTDWDGAYAPDGNGGGELCPHLDKGALTVAGSAFSLVWNIRTNTDALLRVGTIEGTVRPSGLATVTAKLIEPLPAPVVAALAQMDDSADKLRAIATTLHVGFTQTHRRRIQLGGGDDCYANWGSDGKPGRDPDAEPPPPPPTKPLLAPGSPAWDMAYVRTSRFSEDWRCPSDTPFKRLTVAKGRFSVPYLVETRDRYNRSYGEMTLGQLDGTIAAGGKVTLRITPNVTELPPEITGSRPAAEATLDYVRAFTMTGTFTRTGKAHYAVLTSGPGCEIRFESASTFVPGRSVDIKPGKASTGSSCHRDNECASDRCESGHCRAE